jgi:hypothetical protein
MPLATASTSASTGGYRAHRTRIAPRDLARGLTVEFVADGARYFDGKHRQGMHMPGWASRLTLLVEDVRIERLQAIGEADAWAEGVCSAAEAADQQNGKPAWGTSRATIGS